MPACAKPPVERNQVNPQPLTSMCETLLRVSREVADKRSKRATLPALPHALQAAPKK